MTVTYTIRRNLGVGLDWAVVAHFDDGRSHTVAGCATENEAHDLILDLILGRTPEPYVPPQRRVVCRNTWPGPCPCECNSGGFCGGCGHAGCGGLR